LAASIIELISVVENLKLKKSSAAKLPEIIQKIIETKDQEGAAKLIKELSELTKKSGNCE
jgi:signal transduction histidine kinase